MQFLRVLRWRRGAGRLWAAAGWCGIALAGALVGCDSSPSGSGPAQGTAAAPGGAPAASAEHPNVLLISMDTTRADRLACYGHKTIKTPNIDRLAADGVLFEQCVSAAPITLPSHTSMLTGSPPPVHGARDNGAFFVHEANESLAETLKAAGYATAAEIGTFVLNREFGLNQGFDVYSDLITAREVTGDRQSSFAERTAEDVADGAIAQLRENRARRFFQFVHFFDPHRIWQAPPRWAAAYKDGYLAEIAFVDEQIGRILDELTALKLDQHTLVMLTADHGEGLDEHGEQTHAIFVYDATIHVPLIARLPGKLPPGKRIAAQVRTIDIAPTIAALTGTPAPRQSVGMNLAPLMKGESTEGPPPAYAESMYSALYNFGCSGLRCVRAGGWKYIHAPKPELYDLNSDPAETINLADKNPDKLAELRGVLRKLVESFAPAAGAGNGRRDPNAAETSMILSLGYASGADVDDDKSRQLDAWELRGADPKDFGVEMEMAAQALHDIRVKAYPQAEELLRELNRRATERNTPFGFGDMHLGSVLLSQNKNQEAAECFVRALSLRPDDGRVLTNLGTALARMGRTDEAIEKFRKALTVKPLFAQSHLYLALALTSKGEYDEALKQTRAALNMGPKYAAAHAHLGTLLEQAGKPDEALMELEKAVELDPADGRSRVVLGRLLIARDRAAESVPQFMAAVRAARPLAMQALATGLRTDPRYIPVVRDVVWLLATNPHERGRSGPAALQLGKVLRLATNSADATALDALAAAHAECGNYAEAETIAKLALDLTKGGAAATQPASNAGPLASSRPSAAQSRAAVDPRIVAAIEARVKLYAEQKPYHQPAPATQPAPRQTPQPGAGAAPPPRPAPTAKPKPADP